jgi:hypothetical protein
MNYRGTVPLYIEEAKYFFPFPNCIDRHWELFGLPLNEYRLISQKLKLLQLKVEHSFSSIIPSDTRRGLELGSRQIYLYPLR